MWRRIVALLIIFNIVDWMATYYVIHTGLAYELNPFVRALMMKLGVGPALALSKCLSSILLVLIYNKIPGSDFNIKGKHLFTKSILCLGTMQYGLLFFWELYLIFLVRA